MAMALDAVADVHRSACLVSGVPPRATPDRRAPAARRNPRRRRGTRLFGSRGCCACRHHARLRCGIRRRARPRRQRPPCAGGNRPARRARADLQFRSRSAAVVRLRRWCRDVGRLAAFAGLPVLCPPGATPDRGAAPATTARVRCSRSISACGRGAGRVRSPRGSPTLREYFATEAWTFEAMALTRARVITASPGFGVEAEAALRAAIVRGR